MLLKIVHRVHRILLSFTFISLAPRGSAGWYGTQTVDVSSIRYTRKLNEDPEFNQNPILRPRWLVHLKAYLPRCDKTVTSFIKTGAIPTPNGKIIVASRQHAFDLIDGKLPLHDWENPSAVIYSALSSTVLAPDTRVLPDNYTISPLHLLTFDEMVARE